MNSEAEGKDKVFKIIVNGQEKTWDKNHISFEEVVKLAYPDPPPPGVVITYTVEYEGADEKNPDGTLTKGKSVKIKNGTIFGVTETGRS